MLLCEETICRGCQTGVGRDDLPSGVLSARARKHPASSGPSGPAGRSVHSHGCKPPNPDSRAAAATQVTHRGGLHQPLPRARTAPPLTYLAADWATSGQGPPSQPIGGSHRRVCLQSRGAGAYKRRPRRGRAPQRRELSLRRLPAAGRPPGRHLGAQRSAQRSRHGGRARHTAGEEPEPAPPRLGAKWRSQLERGPPQGPPEPRLPRAPGERGPPTPAPSAPLVLFTAAIHSSSLPGVPLGMPRRFPFPCILVRRRPSPDRGCAPGRFPHGCGLPFLALLPKASPLPAQWLSPPRHRPPSPRLTDGLISPVTSLPTSPNPHGCHLPVPPSRTPYQFFRPGFQP